MITRRARILIQISEIPLCDGRLVNLINISPFFIAAGNASVIWESLLFKDCVIKHRFMSGEMPRESEIDGRCQRELFTIHQQD